MKTNLLQLKKQLTFIILLFISVGITGQTLVNYPLDNNLNPNAGPDASITPVSLRYYEPPNTTPSATTNHALGYLNYKNSGDYLQFNFNLPANDNVTLQVNAGTAVFLSAISGNIQIYTQIGTAPETLQQQNLNASSSLFSWFDSDNISFSLPISNPQASAVPVKIRIVGNITSTSGLNIDYFGIGNISLVREITSISVRGTKTPAPSFITHNAGASVTYDTDFGSLLTNEESLDKTYRITNTGSRTLKINSIQLDPNNVDFSIFGAVPTTINTGQSATFTVIFAPTDQGLKTAEVVIAGNITPDNPFRFEVKGNGKSCNLTPVPIAQYGFEGAAPSNMPVSNFSGTIKVIGGTAATPTPNIGTLYLTGNLYSPSSPNKSWYVRGNNTGEVTLEFGPVDLTNQQEVSINFDLAAFGLTNNNNSGVNNSDYVILSVYNPTTNSWSDEIRLNGSDNTTRRKYAYGASGIAEGTYDGNNTAIQFTNNATNYGSFKLNIPASIAQLRYRITAYTSRTWSGGWQNYNLWLIDNVHVDAGNAKVKTWTGTGWTGQNTNRPGPREKAVFAVPYDFSGTEALDLSVCECEINSGATLTIPASKTLTVQNKIVNKGTENNVIVESDGNLIQIENNAVNSGNITALRNMTPRRNTNNTYSAKEYSFYSSPVYGQIMKSIFGGSTANTAFALVLNEPGNNFVNANAAHYNIPGKGFAVKDPTEEFVGSEVTVPATFKGVPNNKIEPLAITKTGTKGWNLIGNPYPSNLDLQKFYNDNKSVMESTIRFWDKTVNNTYAQYGGAYNGYSYALYNAAADVDNPAPGGDAGNNTGTPGGTTGIAGKYRYAKVGQGFLVRSSVVSGEVQFKNTQRSTQGDVFFGRNATADNQNLFRLQLITPNNLLLTQSFVYLDFGTNGFGVEDTGHPSLSSSDTFYSYANDDRVIINGRGTFDKNDVVNLGTKNYAAGVYKIRAIDQEGIFANGQHIYLKDKVLNVIADLTEAPYEFSAEAGEFTNRFEIVYEQETVLGTTDQAKASIELYRDGQDFVVQTPAKKIVHVELYDMSGRLMFSKKANAKTVRFTAETLTEGIYILKGQLEDGEIFTKKLRK